MITHNPCTRAGRLYRSTRIEKIWTNDDETAFLKSAPAHLHLPLLLALWTGQRQGDLLRLPWSAYDGTHIRLKQSKTGARITIPVAAPLKAALRRSQEAGAADPDKRLRTPVDVARLSSVMAHRGHKGGHCWAHISRSARHCRHTARDHGMHHTEESQSLTGHSLRDVNAILDAHYLHRDPALAQSAIRKLEAGAKPRILPTNSQLNKTSTRKCGKSL